jgi:VIT1/CCC1 family predicted Fe2+/Mn2+ transporter
LVFVILKDRFHDFVPALSKWSGTVVGMTLIAIGLMGVYETYFESASAEEEEEQELKLAVAGADGSISTASSSNSTFQQQAKVGLATYATGIVYGLHPDALFVVIPALALPTKLAAVAYCSMFVIGTVAAMGGYTAVIGTTSAALTKERPWLQAHLSTIASGIAIVVGVLILLSGMGLQVPFFG